MTRRLEEELTARERSVAEKKHTQNAVTVKEKLTEQFKQLSACGTELDREVVDGKETVADVNVKLKFTGMSAKYVGYE